MKETVKKSIVKLSEDAPKHIEDTIAVEKKLRISVNGKEIVRLYCTPVMVRELVVGLFMTEGFIKGNWCTDRMTIEYADEIRVDIPAEGEADTKGASITSGCVGGISMPAQDLKTLEDDFRISGDSIIEVFKTFQGMSALYKDTGCIHSAALSDGRYVVSYAEDIGRHNAVDKVIGYCFLERIDFSNKIMLASGRLSSEIVTKCARWGIPIVASRTAPTSLAVEIGDRYGVTVVGFIRGGRMNVYSHAKRIG